MSSNQPQAGAIRATAVTYRARGGPDVIEIAETSVRPAEPGELRIAVKAAAVNPTDVLLRDPGKRTLPPPLTPGMDAAGIVESVGAGVDRFKPGDDVMAVVRPLRAEGGAQAAFIVVSEASVVRKPRNLDFTEAATLPMNGLTALYALDHAALLPGQTFAVSGGAGWLASCVIPIARHRGLRVIADAKPADTERVRLSGAELVVPRDVDFGEAIRQEIPDGVDALLDTALLGERSFTAIRACGIYVPVRGWRGGPADRGIRIASVLVGEVFDRTEWLEMIRDLAERGVLVPRVAHTYPPAEVAAAQQLLLAGGLRGRPVIVF